jgi:hypothetical protein
MRTTLTLDDDIAAQLMDRAKKLGIPFKQVVNRTLRSGLGESAPSGQLKVVVEPYDMGPCLLGPDVNFNRLATGLEDEAWIEKLRRSGGQ